MKAISTWFLKSNSLGKLGLWFLFASIAVTLCEGVYLDGAVYSQRSGFRSSGELIKSSLFAKRHGRGLLTSRNKGGVNKLMVNCDGLENWKWGERDRMIFWRLHDIWSLKLSQLLDCRPGTDQAEIALLALPTEAVPHHLTHPRHTLVFSEPAAAVVSLAWTSCEE